MGLKVVKMYCCGCTSYSRVQILFL